MGNALHCELQSPAHAGQILGIQRVVFPAEGRGDVLLAGGQGSPLPVGHPEDAVEEAAVPDQAFPVDGKAVFPEPAAEIRAGGLPRAEMPGVFRSRD